MLIAMAVFDTEANNRSWMTRATLAVRAGSGIQLVHLDKLEQPTRIIGKDGLA